MRIITSKVNDIYSAARKGRFYWSMQQAADVICIQDIRARLTMGYAF